MQRAAAAVAAALCAATGGVAAHPHGRLACDVRLGFEQGRLAWVAQRLTLDAASSAALAGRMEIGEADPPSRPAALFRDLLTGLFRQSGWMLDVWPGSGTGAAVALDDREAAWTRLPDGRLVLSLRLVPMARASTAPVTAGQSAADPAEARTAGSARWSVSCRDPVWYWLGEFAGTEPVSAVGAACVVTLDAPRDAAEVASALTAASRAAGASGAGHVAGAVTTTRQLGAGRAELRC